MRDYMMRGRLLVPSSAPLLASAWDTPDASIITHRDNSGDEYDFIPKCLERWRDREHLRQRRLSFLNE